MSEGYYNYNDLPSALPAVPRDMWELPQYALDIVPTRYIGVPETRHTETLIVAGEGRRPLPAEMTVASPLFGVRQFDSENPAQSETASVATVDEIIRDAFQRHPDFKDLIVAGGKMTASISLEHQSPQGAAYFKAFSTGLVAVRFVSEGGQSYHEYTPDQYGDIRRDDIDLARFTAGLPQSGELSTAELWEIQHERLLTEAPNLAVNQERGSGGRLVSSAEAAYIAGLLRRAEPEVVPLKELDRLSVARIGSSTIAGPGYADAAQAASEFEVTMRRFLQAVECDPDQVDPVCVEADFTDSKGGSMFVQAGQRWNETNAKSPFVRIWFDQDMDAQAIRRIFAGERFTNVPYATSRINLGYMVTAGVLHTSRSSTMTSLQGDVLHAEQQRIARGDVAEVRKLRGFLRRPTIW